jgi:ribosomal protein S6
VEMSFVVGFICFLFACMIILTLQVWNSRRIKSLENDLSYQKDIITELNIKLQHYEQEKRKEAKKHKGKNQH